MDWQFRVVGVELGSTTATVDEDARFEKLRTEALELTRHLGEVRDRLESLLGQRAYLRFTLLAQRGEGAPQPVLGVVRTTFTYVGEAEAALAKELREQEDRARELSEALQPLLVKMRNPTATGRTVRVDVEVQQEATIGLRYHVDGAGWSPAYNARLVGDDRIELAYFGVVRQHTGEDWTDASVSLSTADTQGSSVLPELEPWYLGRDDGLSLDTGVIVAPLASDAGPTGGGLIASNLTATVEGTGAVVFSLPDRRTVPGDGASQRLPLGTQTFAAALDYTTVPKLVQEVHRRASLRRRHRGFRGGRGRRPRTAGPAEARQRSARRGPPEERR